MASVRLDPKAFRDPRFRILGSLLKTNEFDAIGRLVFVWSYCTEKQSYHLPREVISVLTDNENFADFMVTADLAEVDDDKIRIKGTKGRIEWLGKLRKNSRKGGAARKAKAKPEGYPDGSQKASQTEAKAKPERSYSVGSEPSAAPPAVSPSTQNKLDAGQKIRAFIAAYVEAYRGRYGPKARPACLDDKKTVGEIQRFLANRSLETAVMLIQAYLQIGDKWFCETKAHDFTTFTQNITRIQTSLQTGRENPNKESLVEFLRKQEGQDGPRVLQRANKPT